SRFTVHFHYGRKTLYLTPNPDIDRPFVFNRCGLFITRDGARHTILAVLPDSPAASAGVQAGETVVDVDGKEPSRWDPYLLKERLRGPVGSSLTLRLRRGSEPPRTVALTLKEIL
ncbi:MAG TPA: PDZ domain-containing protein, partial [Pseudomonadota bacterium]|nr:PDZ domain-containing protein [Pseudomonadota bacterium]